MVTVEPVEQGIAGAPLEDDPLPNEPRKAASHTGVRRMAQRAMNLSSGEVSVGSREYGEHVSVEGRGHHAEGMAKVHVLASIAYDRQL